MTVTVTNGGVLLIDDVRLIHKNFSGVGTKFNAPGNRNFSIVIPDETSRDIIVNAGYDVHIRDPREEGDGPFMFLPVKMKFFGDGRDPAIYVVSGKAKNRLTEDTVGMIDSMVIEKVDLDIRPYHWTANGNSGVAAYLQNMCVYQRMNRFETRFAEESDGNIITPPMV